MDNLKGGRIATIVIGILLIIAVIYLSVNIYFLKQEVNQNKINLEEKINTVASDNLERSQEMSLTLLSIKNDLTGQVNKLKASSSSSDFSGIIQESIEGVVSVSTEVAQGSGFLVSSDGYIVTNAHILVGGTKAYVMLYNKTKLVSAKLIGYNQDEDVAILKIDDANYTYLEFGDSNNLQIGEKAVAIGNPLGLSFSVSEGIISGLNREGPNGQDNYIQIDIPLNQGNSGGPLIDTDGKVIGITNFRIANSNSLGFALDSNTAKTTINNIFKDKKIAKEI